MRAYMALCFSMFLSTAAMAQAQPSNPHVSETYWRWVLLAAALICAAIYFAYLVQRNKKRVRFDEVKRDLER